MVTRHGDFFNNLPKWRDLGAIFAERITKIYILYGLHVVDKLIYSCCYYKIININTITITIKM